MDNNLFSFLNIYIDNSFFDIELCDEILNEMSIAPKNISKVVTAKGEVKYDTMIRNTLWADVSKETKQKIKLILDNKLKQKLEKFYNQSFIDFQSPQFLAYDKGHEFKLHHDVIQKKSIEKTRKITIVIFLNQQERDISEKGDYTGGGLHLYGLISKFPKKGFEIPSQKGLLVAFKSDILHEVTPVLSGYRCTLVSWLV